MSTQFTNRQWRLPNNENKAKQSNYSMDFDGSQYVDCGETVQQPTTNFSVSCWVKINNITSDSRGIVSNQTSGVQYGFLLAYRDSKFQFRADGNTTAAIVNGTTVPNTSNWYNVIATYDGTNVKIYVNNVLESSSSYSSTPTATSQNLVIGRWYSNYNDFYFNGKIDAVSIFDYALSSSQITTLYGSSSTGIGNPMSLSPKPVAYYQLGDKSAFNGADYLVPNIAAEEADGDIAVSYSPYALDFDGVNDYIDCGNDASFNLTTGLTVSAWVKLTAYQNDKFILAKRWASNSFQIATAGGGKSQCSVWIGSTRYDAIGSTVLSADTWYNIVGTFDGSNVKVYVNSTLEDTTPASGNLATTTDIVSIAKGLNNNSYNFNGSISNVSIWNVGLTSSQITELYNSGVPSNLNNHSAVSSLVSWWQLGSNSSFNSSLNQWTCIDEKGTNTGESSQTFNEDAIVDGVGSYANGLSSGMGGDEVIGDAPYSTANSLSVNMDVEDRVTDTPS